MPDSVYKVIELVGTSSESWEKAAAAAVNLASKSLRDLRVAEVVSLDTPGEREDHRLQGEAQAVVQVRGRLSGPRRRPMRADPRVARDRDIEGGPRRGPPPGRSRRRHRWR